MKTKPLLLPEPRRLEMTGKSVALKSNVLLVEGVPNSILVTVNRIGTAVPPVSSTDANDIVGWSFIEDDSSREMFRFVSGTGDSVHVKCSIDNASVSDLDSIQSDSYKLTICEHDPVIRINAKSSMGVFYGLITLGQLLRQYGNRLPALIIDDEPSFKHRGVMLDVSRDRVPRMDELYRLVDLLAGWKINHLQLYTEHTFAYRGHETVWRHASPFTLDEIKFLDRYCQQRGIMLAANQNCFGHMQRWLKHEPYAQLAETHGKWSFNGQQRSGPFSLCPIDEGSISLIRDMLSQLLPCFSSGLVNIGCDETFDVGQGRSRSTVEKHGFAKVYADFVNQVIRIANEKDFRAMIWADMLFNNPDTPIDMLPEDIIYIVWDYEPDARFDEWCGLLIESGRESWVCPGTSAWRSITGRTTERKGNLGAAVKGLKAGATGFMVTEWGDMGHHQQAPVTLLALAEAANSAWNADSVSTYNSRSGSLNCFGDSTGNIAKWLEKLGDVDYFLRLKSGLQDEHGNPTPLRNCTCLFKELHTPLSDKSLSGSLEEWQQVSEMLEEISGEFPVSLPKQIADELKFTIEAARVACEIAVLRRSETKRVEKVNVMLTDHIRELSVEHRRLWLLRSREGGLGDSCSYFDSIIEKLKSQG